MHEFAQDRWGRWGWWGWWNHVLFAGMEGLLDTTYVVGTRIIAEGAGRYFAGIDFARRRGVGGAVFLIAAGRGRESSLEGWVGGEGRREGPRRDWFLGYRGGHASWRNMTRRSLICGFG